MTLTRVLVILLLRLWGLNVIVMNVLHGLQYAMMDVGGQGYGTHYYLFESIWIGLGLIAWFLARPLARLIIRDEAANSAADHTLPNTEEFVTIGTFLIGIFQLASRLPSTATHIVISVARLHANETHAQFYQGDVLVDIANVVADVGVVAIALLLTFRPRDLARMFVWLRRTANGTRILDQPRERA